MSEKNAIFNVWPEGSKKPGFSYWVPEELLEKNCNFIKEQLQFKPEYKNLVNKLLKDIVDGNDKETLFVGIHVRRGDYLEFSSHELHQVLPSNFLQDLQEGP